MLQVCGAVSLPRRSSRIQSERLSSRVADSSFIRPLTPSDRKHRVIVISPKESDRVVDNDGRTETFFAATYLPTDDAQWALSIITHCYCASADHPLRLCWAKETLWHCISFHGVRFANRGIRHDLRSSVRTVIQTIRVKTFENNL